MQLEGAVGIGWLPAVDVGMARQPPLNARGENCKKIMEEAGQNMDSALTRLVAFEYCDVLWLLEDVSVRAGSFEPRALRQHVAALGEDFVSPLSFDNRLAAGPFDGVAGARDFAFHDDCTCFKNAGRTRPVR